MSDEEYDDLEEIEGETSEERAARAELDVVLDPDSQGFVDRLVDRLMLICDELAGHSLYSYQRPFARRMFESLIINDGAVLTLLMSRQSGKSETIADVVVTCMIFFPRLAKAFPEWFGKYENGMMVGAFAPVDEQADTLFGRIQQRLQSKPAAKILNDPEIAERVDGRGKQLVLRVCGSLVRKTTCHPRAIIEGRSYHLILIDEAQGADQGVVNKSVTPMGAAYNATMVMTGTPTYETGIFYKQIQINKREHVNKRRSRQNHFECDWKAAAKANKNYERFVKREMVRIGEDSDEFKLSYRILWLLDKGMFATSDVLDECEDRSMQSVVHAHSLTPVVVGIDCGRKNDKTVVTVLYVDWNRPDAFGFYHHRILNWLDLTGVEWEEQYFRIVEFLSNYRVWRIGIDTNGMGGPVAERLRLLMPSTEIIDLGSGQSEQSERWKYLKQLIDRRQIVWPGGAKVRRTRTYKQFRLEMEDLQIHFKGPYVLAEAPHVKDAHDDFPDSLSMAAILTRDEGVAEEAEMYSNVFFSQRGNR
jgi:Terminase RNaseH-like domain